MTVPMFMLRRLLQATPTRLLAVAGHALPAAPRLFLLSAVAVVFGQARLMLVVVLG